MEVVIATPSPPYLEPADWMKNGGTTGDKEGEGEKEEGEQMQAGPEIPEEEGGGAESSGESLPEQGGGDIFKTILVAFITEIYVVVL